MTVVASLIGMMANLLTVLIVIWVIVSWILPPYHPLREALDRIVEPMVAPIRQVLPMAGGIDFSPMILILLIELIARVLISILTSLG